MTFISLYGPIAGNPFDSDFLPAHVRLINKKLSPIQAVTSCNVFLPKTPDVCCYWQVFWLSCFFRAFPFACGEQWQLEIDCPEKPIVITSQDHSYGDSSGFTPDSLLIHHQVKPNAGTNLLYE